MGKRDKSGQSLRETLEVVKRMTGRMPEEGINPAELPEEVAHLWGWFLLLNGARGFGGMGGPLPISESEIGWFFINRSISPEGWEPDAIRRLDAIALNSASTKDS